MKNLLTILRMKLIAILALLIPAGFYTKIYPGPGSLWVHDSLGGVFYVVFWCLVAALVRPQFTAWKNAILITALTCMLEFAQLWKAGWLEILRSYYLGRIILGHSFHWLDFPYYFVGGLIAYWILKNVTRVEYEVASDKV